jgi:hypothetical protein
VKDFFDHQDQAQKATRRLVAGLIALLGDGVSSTAYQHNDR